LVIYYWAVLLHLIFCYLHVDSFTYASGWYAFLCRMSFCDTLVVIFLLRKHHYHHYLGIWDTTTDVKLSIQFVPTGTVQLIYTYVFKYGCMDLDLCMYSSTYIYAYIYTFMWDTTRDMRLSIQYLPTGTRFIVHLYIYLRTSR
jgi:hypothetical protein